MVGGAGAWLWQGAGPREKERGCGVRGGSGVGSVAAGGWRILQVPWGRDPQTWVWPRSQLLWVGILDDFGGTKAEGAWHLSYFTPWQVSLC